MNKPRGIVVAILCAGALTCAALAVAQAQKPAPVPPRDRMAGMALIAPNDSRMIGVSAVRLINTAEMEYKHAHGGYATWDELYRSGLIANDQKRWQQFNGLELAAGPEVVAGWTLALIPSADGQSYELSLRNLGDKCQFSFFSDQRGLIFQGNVIDCAAGIVPASQ